MNRVAWIRAGFTVAILAAWQWAPAQDGAKEGYVLGPEQGEILRRPNGQIIVKADPKLGSERFAMGMQDLVAGAGIGLHRHEEADEVLFIHRGSARAVLGERRVEAGPGTAVFVPRGVWHGLESLGQEVRLVWIVSPPGLEGFFREIGAPPGAALQHSPAEMAEIARRHGTTFAP
jgi:mannose-6-phosphate isomerase-like protein (cupin superfamily)